MDWKTLYEETAINLHKRTEQVMSLKADNQRLRVALKPFAEESEKYDKIDSERNDDLTIDDLDFLTMADLRRAAEVLKASEENTAKE